MNIIIKTKSWMYNFAQKEIENLGFKTTHLDNELLKVEIKNEIELSKLVENVYYYSRTIEYIFLEISKFDKLEKIEKKINLNFINKELSFEVESHNVNRLEEEKIIGEIILNSNDKLKVDLKKPDLIFKILKIDLNYFILLDLIGFDLSKREYKTNTNSNSINSLVSNYLFYLLELDKEKDLSIIDPVCSLGDTIIEASLFNPRIALNIKKRNTISFSKIYQIPKLPKTQEKNKSKYIGIVQNNKIFKQLKENISYSNQKIKTSQYEFDFLDVKFKKGDIKYLVSNLPSIKEKKEEEEFLKEFFYQAEFIVKKKIGVISKKKIDEKILKKYKLWAKIKKEILVGEQKYYIYVILK